MRSERCILPAFRKPARPFRIKAPLAAYAAAVRQLTAAGPRDEMPPMNSPSPSTTGDPLALFHIYWFSISLSENGAKRAPLSLRSTR